jgi:hypothetical protein
MDFYIYEPIIVVCVQRSCSLFHNQRLWKDTTSHSSQLHEDTHRINTTSHMLFLSHEEKIMKLYPFIVHLTARWT